LELVASTGLGVKEAINLTWDDVTDYYVFRPTADDNRPRRGLPAYPLTPQARALLDDLIERPRKPGVVHVLVDSKGAPWGRAWISEHFKIVRDAAQIECTDFSADEPIARKKDIKDLSKTWAIRAMKAGATDDDIIMLRRWKADDVAELRLLAEFSGSSRS
jgi:integrase